MNPKKTLRENVIDSLFEKKVQDHPNAYKRVLIKCIAEEESFLSPFFQWLINGISFLSYFIFYFRTSLVFSRRWDQKNVSQFYFSFLMLVCVQREAKESPLNTKNPELFLLSRKISTVNKFPAHPKWVFHVVVPIISYAPPNFNLFFLNYLCRRKLSCDKLYRNCFISHKLTLMFSITSLADGYLFL